MKVDIVQLLSAARITASGNVSLVDLSEYEGEGFLVLSTSATEAADNTYNIALEHSDDNTTFTPVSGVSFSQVTNAAGSFQKLGVRTDGLKPFIRAVETLAGTSPAVVRSLCIVGREKY